MELPPAFDPAAEHVAFLASAKKKAAAKFSLTKASSLQAGMELAYWLYVYRRDAEADQVCRHLGLYEFSGDYNLWNWVERGLALQSRIARQAGKPGESQECRDRIAAAGYVDARLAGSLLRRHLSEIADAVQESDATAERAWRRIALSETTFIVEMGGSAELSADAAEAELQTQLAALRTLQKVPATSV